MSYQFDASRLRVQSEIKTDRATPNLRLLSRRTARQTRRAQRAI